MSIPTFEIPPPSFPTEEFNIKNYGAVGDGKAMCSGAIEQAIEKCENCGGGKIIIPPGKWLTGPIHLRSNMELHISKGAEVLFSNNFDDYLPVVQTRWEGTDCYNYSPLIYANNCENIAITGTGKLNGQGEAWWHWKMLQQHGADTLTDMGYQHEPIEERVFGTPSDALRPSFIQTINCKNVYIHDVKIMNGPMWTVHPVYCENVHITGIQINTNGPNNDGIVPDSCMNVLIENCLVSSGDDCIVIKSGDL